jgi:hypothetical protein
MSNFSNGLSAAEAERLALLLEELGEAQQVIGKILRHGYESINPLKNPEQLPPTNREMLERELGDALAAMDLLRATDVRSDYVEHFRTLKHAKLPRWTHHQPPAITGQRITRDEERIDHHGQEQR